ncbi:MAG: DUF4363 family protein [Acutalibacteraceae bacterium]|nr:DUF4363 family protein [Acutalibacteraceae bacterium]
MKRLLIAVLVLSFTITFSVGSYFLICRSIDNVIFLMENDRNITVSSGESDKERTEKILDEWLKQENLLVSLLTHHELEDIETGIRCLEDYMKQGLTEEYIKTLNECINKLRHVKETELPDIKNIF